MVVGTEVGGPVHDDSLDGHKESLVETADTVALGDGLDAVDEAVELASLAASNIGTETGTGEVEGVDEAQAGCSGGTSGGKVSEEVTSELGLLVDSGQEHLLVGVLESKVEGLGWEVSDELAMFPLQK